MADRARPVIHQTLKKWSPDTDIYLKFKQPFADMQPAPPALLHFKIFYKAKAPLTTERGLF